MDIYRAITIATALIALVVWSLWLHYHRDKWGYAVGILIWICSVLMFNFSIVAIRLSGHRPNALFYNHWSHVNYWLILFYLIAFALLWWRSNGHRLNGIEEKGL